MLGRLMSVQKVTREANSDTSSPSYHIVNGLKDKNTKSDETDLSITRVIIHQIKTQSSCSTQ